MIQAIPECACGVHMTPVRDTGAFLCDNCDTCQPRERDKDEDGNPVRRRLTSRDRRFHLAWEVRKREFYPNQR